MRLKLLSFAAVAGLALAGCSGSGNNGILGPIGSLGPSGNTAKVVFVNGSPDAGPVEVTIDTTQQFCATGQSGSQCVVSYGQITPTGSVSLSAGSHAITIANASGTALQLPSGQNTFSVNGGGTYSIVLAGELHPTSGTPNLQLLVFNDQPFANSPAVNFHNASPFAQTANGGAGVQFGYYNGSTPSSNPLGQPVTLGSETTPQSIPTSAQNTPITFYATIAASNVTAQPSAADATNCANNQLPCSGTNHLNWYLIDGPADSTSPTAPPANISAGATAALIGTFVP